MKRILISGYYGFRNTGDEAILSAMITSLTAEISNAEITVASACPRETEERYAVKAIPRSIRSIFRALKKTDLFISGGGGLLQDTTSMKSLMYYCALLLLARVRRVPIMIYGQGVGPIKRSLGRFLVKLAVSGCDLITVRDERSKRELEKIGVKRDVIVTADPAFLLKPARASKLSKLKRPIVGFALRAWPDIDFSHIAQTADEIAGNLGATVTFIPFHAERDYSVAEQITRKMKEKAVIIDNIDLPSEALGVVGELDVLVGMRLHSNIFAAIQGIPFVPIAYDPKVEELSASVGVLNPLQCKDVKNGEIVLRVKELLSLDKNLNYPVDSLRLRARLNANLAKQLLNERRVLGIRFDALEMDEAAEIIERYIEEEKPRLIVTLNAEMMVMAKNDPAFRSVLMKADLLIPDSVGIAWAGRVKARVPGIDLIDELARRAVDKGYRIFMIGSAEGVAKKAAAKLIERYPGLQIAGVHSGYFSWQDEKRIVDKIRDTKPDILLVGLGMGKQEKWIAKYLRYLGVPACLGVGGSFDVIAGEVKRAPVWVRQAGLEWLYRFIQQPTRFKRMLALPKFIFYVWRERFSSRS